MNITSLSPNNVSFRTQAPPPPRAATDTQNSGRFPQHHGKITSVVTADASQASTAAAGSLLNTLV